jgi:hypothetical protein
MVVGDWTVTQPYEAPAAPEQAAETSRHAITALVWAIFGWTVLPFVGSVLALVYAGRAERAVRSSPWLSGEQMAGAARSLAVAWFLYFLLVLAIVAGVFLGTALAVEDVCRQVGC